MPPRRSARLWPIIRAKEPWGSGGLKAISQPSRRAVLARRSKSAAVLRAAAKASICASCPEKDSA